MLPIVDVRDLPSPFERGVSYGAQARAQIARSIATYKLIFANNGIPWEIACGRGMRYLDPITTVDRTLVEELRGIAQGAGVTLGDILALNCRSEILPPSFLEIFADEEEQLARPDLNECTSIMVSPEGSTDGHTWLAQNWDWVGMQREALVLLRTVDHHGLPIDTLTEAGMLAKIGMNRHGLAVGLNMLRSLGDGRDVGVPVHVLLRRCLSCATLAEARTVLNDLTRDVGFGSASNMPCADAEGDVGSFEFSPAGWEELRPDRGVVVHTNHFLCSTLIAQQAPMESRASTDSRLSVARAVAARAPLSAEDLKALLRDESMGENSICRHPDPELPPEGRVESVVAVLLNCSTRTWWLAFGIPSMCDFEELVLPSV